MAHVHVQNFIRRQLECRKFRRLTTEPNIGQIVMHEAVISEDLPSFVGRGKLRTSQKDKLLAQYEACLLRKGWYHLDVLFAELISLKHNVSPDAQSAIVSQINLHLDAASQQQQQQPITANPAADPLPPPLPAPTSTMASSTESTGEQFSVVVVEPAAGLQDNDGSVQVTQIDGTTPYNYPMIALDDAKQLLVKKDIEIMDLKKTIKQLRRQLANSNKQNDVLKTKHLELVQANKAAESATLAIQKAKKSENRLSHRGLVALGVRRNLTCISCADVGALLLEPNLTRWKVSRAESISSDALVQASRNFYLALDDAKASSAASNGFSLCCQSATSDATNSRIWQRRKLSTMKLTSAFLTCPNFSWDKWCQQSIVCDVLPVEDGAAEHTLALLMKHMRSVGAEDIVQISRKQLYDNYESRQRKTPKGAKTDRHFDCFWYTSDRGSDQVKTRKLLGSLTDPIDSLLWMDSDCFQHQNQLIVKDELLLADRYMKAKHKVAFYSTTTKSCHTQRELARELFEEWANLFGNESALACARTLCPLCVGARWGSVYAVLRRFLRVNVARLVKCLIVVLSKKANKRKTKKASKTTAGDKADELDQIAIEESALFSEKMTRWGRETVKGMSLPLYQPIVVAVYHLLEPLMHHHHFMLQRFSDETIAKDGNHLAQLVSHKADEIVNEFAIMIEPNSEFQQRVVETTAGLADEHHADYRAFVAAGFMTCAGGYHRRIITQIRTLPLALLLLAQAPHDEVCDRRMAIATIILETPIGKLHPTARKFRTQFYEDLKQASTAGTLFDSSCPSRPSLVWVAMRKMREIAQADVAENERFNSILKRIGDRAPSISLRLISGRLQLKGWMGVGQHKDSAKAMRQAIQKAEDLMQVLMDGSAIRGTSALPLSGCADMAGTHEHVHTESDADGIGTHGVAAEAAQPIQGPEPAPPTTSTLALVAPAPQPHDREDTMRWAAPPNLLLLPSEIETAIAPPQPDEVSTWATAHAVVVSKYLQERVNDWKPAVVRMQPFPAWVHFQHYGGVSQCMPAEMDGLSVAICGATPKSMKEVFEDLYHEMDGKRHKKKVAVSVGDLCFDDPNNFMKGSIDALFPLVKVMDVHPIKAAAAAAPAAKKSRAAASKKKKPVDVDIGKWLAEIIDEGLVEDVLNHPDLMRLATDASEPHPVDDELDAGELEDESTKLGIADMLAKEQKIVKKAADKIKTGEMSATKVMEVAKEIFENDADSDDDAALGGMPGMSLLGSTLEDIAHEAILNSDEGLGVMDVGATESVANGGGTPVTHAMLNLADPVTRGTIIDEWLGNAAHGRNVLEERMQHINAGTAIGASGEMSLVEVAEGESRSVQFIHWISADTRLGQISEIDDEGGVKCVMPFKIIAGGLKIDTPPAIYDGAIVHPAVHVKNKRKRKGARDKVPQNILTLQRMWGVAIAQRFGGIRGPMDVIPKCHVCKGTPHFDEPDGDAVARQCSLCLLPYHLECALMASEHCSPALEILGQFPAGVLPSTVAEPAP